jgi:hypothetical protein
MRFRSFSHVGRALVLLAAGCAGAHAQSLPPPGAPPAQNQTCIRLESQLAAIDRGAVDPVRAEQVRRYEESVAKQQAELDRLVAQARRSGCEGSGFFLFGGGGPQCGDINGQIERMRANLARMTTDLQRLQSGGSDRGEQRRSVLIALAQNDCGPQYANAVPQRQRGFFETLFGGPQPSAPSPDWGNANPDVPQSSTYRTLCVRTCDGFYFPISYATVPSRFADDERACQRMCPAAEVMLFSHRNPGEDVSQAVSTSGRRYTELPAAFHYRQEYVASCSCRRPGQSWADAMGKTDQTIESGDIVITEERAKAMAMPIKPEPAKLKPEPAKLKPEPTKPAKRDARAKGKPEPAAAAPAPPAAPAPEAQPAEPTPVATPADKSKIRSVGPQFLVR